MDFSQLHKYMRLYAKEDSILNFNLSVYYNHINVYSSKKNTRPFTKNLYSINSIGRLICCVALMKQIQDKKISLCDKVSELLSIDFPDITISDFMHFFFYADTEDKIYNFTNMKKIIENCLEETFNDYILKSIIKPLKMKSASFSSDTDKFIVATIDDYARFCDTICAGADRNCKILSKESINTLTDDIIFKGETTNNRIINLKNNNSFIVIDFSSKITIVFAQYSQNTSNEQFEKYEKIEEMVYNGSGVNTWSKGFNVFP